MTCRNELRGIAAGIAGKFISRNTDIDGYWAMGVLYEAADKGFAKHIRLDLLSGESLPTFRWTNQLIAYFQTYLFQQVQKRGFEEYQITGAVIDLEFAVIPTKRHLLSRRTWGDPFVCRVGLTDDLQKTHVYEALGWCGKHDPRRERRSTRRWPYDPGIFS